VSVAASAQGTLSVCVSVHVRGAKRAHHAQRAERAVDGVAAFHPGQRRDAAGLHDALDVVGGSRHLEGVGIPGDHPVHDVDLFQHRLDRRLTLERRGHVHRPELPADSSGPQAWNVGHRLRLRTADVDRRQVERRHVFADRPRVVVVAVDERRGAVDGSRSLEQVIGGRLACGGDGGKGRHGYGRHRKNERAHLLSTDLKVLSTDLKARGPRDGVRGARRLGPRVHATSDSSVTSQRLVANLPERHAPPARREEPRIGPHAAMSNPPEGCPRICRRIADSEARAARGRE
jgi:hypothetical protein